MHKGKEGMQKYVCLNWWEIQPEMSLFYKENSQSLWYCCSTLHIIIMEISESLAVIQTAWKRPFLQAEHLENAAVDGWKLMVYWATKLYSKKRTVSLDWKVDPQRRDIASIFWQHRKPPSTCQWAVSIFLHQSGRYFIKSFCLHVESALLCSP